MSDAATNEGGSGRDDAELPLPGGAQPVRAFLDRAVRAFGPRPALRFMGRVTSYADFNARIDEATGVLRMLGAGPGVRIGLMLPSSPVVAVYVYAAFAVGATVVPLDPDAPQLELSEAAATSKINLLVTCDLAEILPKALALARPGGIACVVVVSFASMLLLAQATRMRLFSPQRFARPPLDFPCPIYLERALLRDKNAETVMTPSREATPRAALLDDIAFLSNGSAGGLYRTAELTQAHIASNLAQIYEALPALTPGQERIVAAVPIWHPLAFALAVNVAVAAGAELTIVHEITGKALAGAVRRSPPPTVILAPVPLLSEMLADPEIGAPQFGSLRFCLAVAGTVSAALHKAMSARTAAPLLDTYGLSLAPTVAGITHPDDAGIAANTRALSGTHIVVRDFADLSREVQRGERGEICVSGAQVAIPQQITPNAGAFTGNELRTGDLGLIDAKGRLFVVDRVEDLIVAAGYLIYPRRIEAALLEHPDVIDAAVIGVGDGKRGNAPKAFVVIKRGVAMTERDLRMFLASRISKIEMPADIDFCTVLPRTAFGLICKARLREAEVGRRA